MELKVKIIVIFYSGILIIGGIVIEVVYKDVYIFFDFGIEFWLELDLFDDYIEILINNCLVLELKDLYDLCLGYEYYGIEDKEY